MLLGKRQQIRPKENQLYPAFTKFQVIHQQGQSLKVPTHHFLRSCEDIMYYRHAMHARVFYWGWVDYLKHCKLCLHFYRRKEEY